MATAESDGGGDACSFSFSLDRTHHHSPRTKRRMSDEEQQEDAKQPKTPSMKDFMDGFLERQDAAQERIAAQAVAQTEKMTAQTQQIHATVQSTVHTDVTGCGPW